jgi:hypothetical protein
MDNSRQPQRIPLDLIEAKLHLFDEAPEIERSLSPQQFFIHYYDRLRSLRQDKGYSYQQMADFLRQHFDIKLSPATVKQYLSNAKPSWIDEALDEDDTTIIVTPEKMAQALQNLKDMLPKNDQPSAPSEET